MIFSGSMNPLGLTSRDRRSLVSIPHQRGHLYRLFGRACRPKPITALSAWSDRHRVLTSKASGEPGRWRTDRTPYLREILDQLSDASPTQRIVLRFASQLGKTEVGLNWIGYIMDHAPGPMLVVLPTLEVRKRWVRQRLDPLLQVTPALSAIFDSRSKRDAGNAEDLKDFPGGMLVIGGANSPASLASMPIRYVLCDEVDRFPWEAGKEGDPLGLIDERTKTFPRRKVMLVSTPTVAGLSRIDDEYQASDQRQYQVPCPHCGTRQVLLWTRPDGERGLVRSEATGTVRYRCLHCDTNIDEHHKTAMLAAGLWVPQQPGRPVRGYALNGLYSPIGLGFTWSELWAQWQDCQNDVAKLKRFVNTTLGETWEEQGDSLDALHLMARLEDYPETLPAGLRAVGIDVQKDRLELTVIDVGPGEEVWVQDHLILPGDTALQPVWDDLSAELRELRPQAVAIDTGYNTSLVHAFAATRGWVYPVKGMPGPNRPIVEDERCRRQRLRHKNRRGAPIHLVGVDQAKALIYARVKLQQPGPGYIHFPARPAFDDEYFAQLAAEKLITKVRGSRAYAEWVQTRARNEALDCLVYALAAVRLSGQTIAPRPESEAPTPAAKPAPAPARPVKRSNFVSRWK